MAHISHRLGPFTGQVGPVVFVKGEAETDDPDMLGYFAEDPDTYDVTEDVDPESPGNDDPDGDPDPDEPQE